MKIIHQERNESNFSSLIGLNHDSTCTTKTSKIEMSAANVQGYKVLRRDKRSGPDGEWYVSYERLRHCRCMIYDLIQGRKLMLYTAHRCYVARLHIGPQLLM